VGGGLLRLPAERADGFGRVVGTVDGRSRHEHVGARVGAPLDRLRGDATVDLKPDGAAAPPHHLTGTADLRQHEVKEFLPTETRLDRHEQQHVDLGQQVLVRLDRGARVDREPGPGPGGADRAQRPHRRLRGLSVDGHAARSGLRERRRVPVRVLDHEVAVDRQSRVLQQRLDDRQAEREVRHEVVVHDVDVQPVGGAVNGRGLLGEPGEVRGQDAGRDLNGHMCSESRARRAAACPLLGGIAW
jgi:hypothetical protein